MTKTIEDSKDTLSELDPHTDDEDEELDYKCGELRMLSETFTAVDGDTASESTVSAKSAGTKWHAGGNQDSEAIYGPTLDGDQAAAAVPEGEVNTTPLSICCSLVCDV